MNPFVYGTVVRGEHFYDRKDECKRIVSTISGGNNLVLFAPRRYGKTSLVFRAMEELQERGLTCIYFDFMPVYSVESFITSYVHAISSQQTNLQRFTQTLAGLVQSLRPKLTFDADGTPELGIDFAERKISAKTLSDVLDLPQTMVTTRKKVVVIFDEFQEVTKFSQIDFEGLLRSKVQQQSVRYLFLGSKTHLLNEMFTSKKRPFYNAAQTMQIDTLPQDETIAYLVAKFKASKITLTRDVAAFVLEKAANIPYYIQLLAAEIWQAMIGSAKVVTREIVERCAYEIVQLKSDYYQEMFDRLSVMQKQLVMALLIDGKNVFSKEYVERFRLSSPSTTQKAMKTLFEYGIVDKTDGEYFINDPFLRYYLTHYTSRRNALKRNDFAH